MSIFVDTGLFYAHQDEDAARHEDAVEGFERVLGGEYGQPYTSEFIFDEAVTLTRRRTNSFEAADTIANRIRGTGTFPAVHDLLYVGPDDLAGAHETFRNYRDHDLSFTDATTIHLCEQHGIDAVFSFDSDFDGIIDRIEPAA